VISVEPTNVPCARCGAPMREDPGSHLAASVVMRCGYCGATELLPADAEQRVLALRSLEVERRWAEDAARGPAVTYLRLVESSGTFLVSYAFAGALLVAQIAWHGLSAWAAFPIGVIGGAGLATYLAVVVARRRLRATLGPLIRAFPGPPGRPQRCRRCGAELPMSASAFVACRYCDAPNLTSYAIASAHGTALREQTADARLYAAETAGEVAAAGRFVARAITGAFVVGAAAGVAVAHLIASRV
jgi:DNA-directed RNA polymerase subunit RPC12/RpoP